MLRFLALFGIVISMLLAACGGDEGDSTSPDQPQPDAATLQATPTRSIYQATWTPVPTQTPLAEKTVAYTYVLPPTGSPVYIPTQLPTQIPPTFDALAATAQAAAAMIQGGAASNTSLLLSASLLNAEAAEVLAPVIGSFIDAPPTITFDEDHRLVAMDVVMRGSDGTTRLRSVMLKVSVSVAGNAIRLVKEEAYYAGTDDEGAPYSDPIGDFVLGSIDTALNNLLRERYQQINPGGGAFVVVNVKIAANGVTVRTDAVGE